MADATHESVAAVKADVPRNVILMGASAGGISAIGKVLSELPPNLSAAIAVTLHRSPTHSSTLAHILSRHSKLQVAEARHGELFAAGRVYLAPPDFHLVFGSGLILLNHGPRENHSRPSINMMFRSGARNYGPRVVGVILTGNLSDGVAGLIDIKRHGGLSLAQEPSEALAPSMPLHALVYDDVDIVFRLAAGGEVLSTLVAAKGVEGALKTAGTRNPKDRPLVSGD